MWSNDSCCAAACYIHPAVPYIILLPSVRLVWCFVSTFPPCVCQLHCIVLQWNMDATAPFIFGRSSLTVKYWGRSHRKKIISHLASFTWVASNKSKSSEFLSWWQLLSICHLCGDATLMRLKNFRHHTNERVAEHECTSLCCFLFVVSSNLTDLSVKFHVWFGLLKSKGNTAGAQRRISFHIFVFYFWMCWGEKKAYYVWSWQHFLGLSEMWHILI